MKETWDCRICSKGYAEGSRDDSKAVGNNETSQWLVNGLLIMYKMFNGHVT